VSTAIQLRVLETHAGCAICQAVSCLPVTEDTQVRSQDGEQSDTGKGFLRVLRFPVPVSFPQFSKLILHSSITNDT